MPNTSGTSGPSHMYPDRETTQYQVAVPTSTWTPWKRSVPGDVALYKRIHALIKADLYANGEGYHPADADHELVKTLLSVRDRPWRAWRDSLPASVPVNARLRTLIKLDADREGGETDDANLRLISLKFQRVEQRVENTLDALDDGDESRAREELEAIDEIARGFTQG